MHDAHRHYHYIIDVCVFINVMCAESVTNIFLANDLNSRIFGKQCIVLQFCLWVTVQQN